MTSTGFDDILHGATLLAADVEVGSELPRVERTLIQIKDAANKMAYKSPSIVGDTADVKASLLLGSRGYDMSKVSQKLESLNRAKTFEPLEPIKDIDIQGFLRNEHENAMLAAAEHTRNITFEESRQVFMDSLECEWEKDKQKLLNSLIEVGDANFEFEPEQSGLMEETAFSGCDSRLVGPTSVDSPNGYEDVVVQYNASVINGGIKGNFSSMFVDISKKHDDQMMLDLWSMIETIIEACAPTRASNSLRTSVQYQSALISGAISYLERSFLKYIEKMVACNLHQAQRGGVPGTYNLIRSYFNIRHPISQNDAEDGLLDGYPVWALIYYCIRCGDKDAMSQVIEKSRRIIGDYADILTEFLMNRKLSPNAERIMKLQYRRIISSSIDPYKRLVCCLVGKCDPQDDHLEVSTTTDDYMWLKLSQLTSQSDYETPEQLTLSKFQHILLDDFGEAHFGASQKPMLYFKILMMSGQFESAIEFLSRFESHKSVAVHVALVLYESHLLLLPQNPHVQLLVKDGSESPLRRLNFARLITMFTKRFEHGDPQKAINYYFFLRDLVTATGDNLFILNICDLVMATREFDLLGQLQLDGTRRPGVIDRFTEDPLKIIERIAHECETKGMLIDAVVLNDLASNNAKVIQLVNKLLSQILSQSASSKLNRETIKKLALSVSDRYTKQNISSKVSQSGMNTFHLLLDISSFFDCFHDNKYEEAYSIISDLDFLPFSEEVVEEKVKNFCAFSDEIRRCLPDILLATMTILLFFCKELGPINKTFQQGVFSSLVVTDSSKVELLRKYKCEAHALVTFSGSMPYRMPADTTARLVHMEASIK